MNTFQAIHVEANSATKVADSILPGIKFQRGASLIVSLLMLVAVLILGISAAEIALKGEKASRNDRDRQIAFQSAEAALIDAENDIQNLSTSLPLNAHPRSQIFSKNSAIGFVQGCGVAGDYQGLCTRNPDGGPAIWQQIAFEKDPGNKQNFVEFGTFTGQDMQIGAGSLPQKKPRYIIELFNFNKVAESAEPTETTYFYRITAVGFGTRDTTQVALQSFYRKE